jgi:hypothetical protein
MEWNEEIPDPNKTGPDEAGPNDRPDDHLHWELVAELKDPSSLLEVQTLGLSLALAEIYEETGLLWRALPL